MKLELHNSWLRLVVELWPHRPAIRRYRIVPVHLSAEVERVLRRRIRRNLQGSSQPEVAG